jgi:hypothetical protein
MQKRKPLTPAEMREQRRAEVDVLQQMEAAHAAERAEKQAEQDKFMAKVEANRQKVATAMAAGTYEPPHIPTWHERGEADRAARQAAQAEAESARIAALTPRQIWMSTLSYGERQRIEKWEFMNKMEYPFEVSST